MLRNLPPLNALRAFEAAARHLSFNHAAEELHVTASAISHQVRTLEKFLGVQLFRRLNRQVALTAAGQSYLPALSGALDQIDRATRRVRQIREERSLTISVTPSFATGWLVPRLLSFQMQYADIEVRLITSIEAVDFIRSDVDLAVRFGSGDWPGLYSHRLLTEAPAPVCSPRLLQEHPLQHPADLRFFTLLHALPRLDKWRNWLNAVGVTGIDAERGPKFQTMLLTLEAAIAGLGVAMADRRLAARELASGELVLPFAIDLPSSSAYYLVYPEERKDDPRIGKFRDWLLAEVAQSAADEQPLLDLR